MDENKKQNDTVASETNSDGVADGNASARTSDTEHHASASKKEKKKQRRVAEGAGAKEQSLASWLIKLLTTFFVRVLDTSVIVRYFTKDDAMKQACGDSKFLGYFKSGKMQLRLLNKKHFLLDRLENSRILRLGNKEISATLLKTPLRYYGAFLLSFAFASCFAYWMDLRYLGNYFAVTTSQVVTCIPILIVGIALLFLNGTPYEYVRTGFLLKGIVFTCFGANPKKDDSPARQYHYPLTLLLGGLLGSLSLIIPLKTMLLILAFIVFGVMILKSPETGVLLTIVGLFFIPFSYTCCVITVTWISFIFKFFSGKRILKYEYVDLTVVFVALIVLGGGLFSLGKFNLLSALFPLFITSLYFLITGLIHDRVWAGRCRTAMTACGIVSTVNVLLRRLPGNPLGISMQLYSSSDLGGKTDSVMQNSGALTLVLAMLFFLQLANFYSRRKNGEKAAHLLLCVLFAAATLINLPPRAAILFVALGLYAMLTLSKELRFVIPLTAVFFIIAPIFGFPTVSSIFSDAAADVISRHESWIDYFNVLEKYDYTILFTGIGMRHDALSVIFSDTLTPSAPGSGLLECVIRLGVPTVVLAVTTVTVRMLKYCLSHCRRCPNKKTASCLYTHAGLISIGYTLLLGITENVGYNYRCVAFFWLILGFTASAQRYTARDTAKEYSDYDNMTFEI